MRTVSIIIPIFNSEKFLVDLFDCLDQCDFYDDDEIILIDNGSKDKTSQMCKNQAERCNRYKYYYYDEKADSYAARNYGIRKASGEILVFTDSDCKPTKKWLRTIRNSIQPGVFIAGNVQLEIVENSIWECFDSITHLSQTKNNLGKGCVATANMSVLKIDLMNRVGFFEERFAGGDFEWSKRAIACGMQLKFCEDALVYHPSRKTYKEIATREKRSAYGAGKHYRITNDNKTKLIVIYILKIFKFDTYLKLVRQMRKKNVSVKDILRFIVEYFWIRVQQLGAAIAGYEEKDPRELGIK